MARPKKNGTAAGKGRGLSGVQEIVTEASPLWNLILKRFQAIGRAYGFSRVETPLLEDMSLYRKYYGNDEAILSRMLVLDPVSSSVAVRPTLLPSVLRTYAAHKIGETNPLSKWLYFGNVVSYGESRQLHSDYEFGLEVFGVFNHLTEAQAIGAVWQLLQTLGLEGTVLEINAIGTTECQVSYQNVLKDFLREKKFELCDDCNEHLQNRSLNVFRCSNIGCQSVLNDAPTILDFLDETSHKHFTNILEALDELQIPYQLNPLYVGRDGSSRTNLIIKYKDKDQTIVIGEGSYHDGIMEELTGKNSCCFGFTGSLVAIQQAMELSRITVDQEFRTEVFLVPLGELAAKKSLRLFRDLTTAHVSVYDHFGTAGVKNQLRQAEAYKSPIALIMGQKEAMDEMVILRDVKSGMQEIFSYDKIVEEVKKRLGK